jgi:phage repressor protein C with HTH and peptisase S24 domain
MDQGTLAKAAGVPQPTLSALELRDSNRSNYADQLISALPADRVNIEWVRTGQGSMTDVPQVAATNSDSVEEAGRPRRFRRVPVVGTAKMGTDGFFEEFSEMPGAGDGHIEIATEDPNAYCLRVRGQSMFPAIRDGWYVLVEPNGQPREGEYVLLKLRNGMRMVKELMYRRQSTIEVMSVNGGERLSFDFAELDDKGMQAVGAVVSPSKWRPE